MKNKRNSDISDSEISVDSLSTNRNSIIHTPKKKVTSGNLSDSSADSEDIKQSTKGNHEAKAKVTTNPLEKLLIENPNLTKLVLSDYIAKEHDVCVLDIPKNINIEDFMGKVVNFNRKTKIKLNKIKYIVQPSTDEIKPINILTNNLRIVHPVAHLKVLEYSKTKHDIEKVNTEVYTPVIPENLKVRHPLFGADYKTKIVLNERVEKKLDNMIEKAVKKLKKKKKQKEELHFNHLKKEKKHKRKNIDADSIFEASGNHEAVEDKEPIFSLLETHWEKRSRSLTEETFESELCTNNSLETQHEKKARKVSVDGSFDKSKKSEKKKRKNSKELASGDSIHQPERNDSFENNRKHSVKDHEKKRNSVRENEKHHSDGEAETIKVKRKHSFQKEVSFDDSLGENAFDNDKKIKKHKLKSNKESKSENKKRKISLEEEIDTIKLFDSFGGKSNEANDLREKQRKHSNSMTTIDEIKNDNRTEKHKRIKDKSRESFDDAVNPNETEEKDSYTKKKKRKSSVKDEHHSNELRENKKTNDSDETEAKHDMKNESFGSDSRGSRKEKSDRKKNSIVNSTLIAGIQLPLFEFDVSQIGNKDDLSKNVRESEERKTKEKKRKSKSFNMAEDEREEEEEKCTINKDDGNSSPPSKKKRKKSEDTGGDSEKNALIASLLNKVKSNIKQKNKKVVA